MLSDITLGQYFPAKSVLHRADPRMKICLTIFVIVLIFDTGLIGRTVKKLFRRKKKEKGGGASGGSAAAGAGGQAAEDAGLAERSAEDPAAEGEGVSKGSA